MQKKLERKQGGKGFQRRMHAQARNLQVEEPSQCGREGHPNQKLQRHIGLQGLCRCRCGCLSGTNPLLE